MKDEHSAEIFWHPETTEALTTMVIERHKARRLERAIHRTWPLLPLFISLLLLWTAFKIIDSL